MGDGASTKAKEAAWVFDGVATNQSCRLVEHHNLMASPHNLTFTLTLTYMGIMWDGNIGVI